MSQKKASWPEIGIITKNVKKDKDKNDVLDSNGNPVTVLGFKLADNVTILVDGKPVAGRYGNLTTPIEEVERLIKAGVIEEEKVEERRESAKKVHSWLRYKIQLPPPKGA